MQARLVVFISGSGTNLQALIDAVRDGRLAAEIVLVVSNRQEAYGLQRAQSAGIPTLYFPFKPYREAGKSREAYDADLAVAVARYKPDFVVLAGWMHILSPAFLTPFAQQVINLHPALPGTFPGTHAIERAFEAFQRGEISQSGCMVHYTVPEIDAGPVIAQTVVPFLAGDSLTDFETRLHQAEHHLLVEAMALVIQALTEKKYLSEEAQSMSELLQDTIEITRAAGAAIMQFYQAAFSVTDKKPDNPVTDADFAADSLLKERLLARLPEAGWLSEETVDSPDRLTKKQVWVVDPLDGTKEFVLGIPEFSVSVGLVEEGEPILAVVFNPATDELFAAEKGGGVWLNGRSTGPTSREVLPGSSIDASRTEIKRGEFDPFKDSLTLNVIGSIAYKLARVASGVVDGTWSRGTKNEWDICAGVLLVQEGGGVAVNLDNEPFRFNRPNPLVNGIIADNGRLHSAIIEALAPYRDTARKE